MRHRTTLVAAIILLVLTTLAIPACRRPFTPRVISAELVPEDVRRGWLESEHVSDVVWHVSEADWHGGLSLYAATYTYTAPDGSGYREAYVCGTKSGSRPGGAAANIGIEEDQPFWGQTGSGHGIIEGDDDPYNVAVSIDAGGYCFDSRATEIVAKTTEGREFRCPVTNGFWLIFVNDAKPAPNPVEAPLELWAEITARSSSGKVLHRLDLGRRM